MRIKKLAVVPTEERRQVSLRAVGLKLGEIWQPVTVLRIAIWQNKGRRVETV
jgi:hypothetical protein